MNPSAKSQNEISERVNQQLRRIENILDQLLENFPILIENLPTSQRLSLATKMMSQYVRMLALQYTMQIAHQASTDAGPTFVQLQEQMRMSPGERTNDISSS